MQKSALYSAESKRFTSYLALKHLRKTPERFEILRCAIGHDSHFDADSLYKALESKGYHVSRATIYSTLELLCGAGIVRKLLFDTHQAQYEMAGTTHSHLICTECGEIKEISMDEADNKLMKINFDGFAPSYISTCVYGICKKCRSKMI